MQMWIHIGASFVILMMFAGFLFYDFARKVEDLATDKQISELRRFIRQSLWKRLGAWIGMLAGVTLTNMMIINAVNKWGETTVITVVIAALVGAGLLKVGQLIFKKNE